MKTKKQIESVRLNDTERLKIMSLRKKANKVLSAMDLDTYSDSQFAHKIFELSLDRIKIDSEGQIFIE